MSTFTPSNATNKTGTWTSDDETVASVNSSGAVTAVGVGSTYINFESNDGPSDYALITVTAADRETLFDCVSVRRLPRPLDRPIPPRVLSLLRPIAMEPPRM
jgi:uncharacterized protein YjdB